MKKLLSAFLFITILFSTNVYASMEYSESNRSVYLDGAYIDINNIVVGDAEYLPIKELCGILGYEIRQTSESAYEITESDGCRNSESSMGKVLFTVGEKNFVTYSKESECENKTETFPEEPVTFSYNDEIYISAYYFGRMFEIKTKITEDMKILLVTVNEQKRQSENLPDYRGNIFVYNTDNELKIKLDGKTLSFYDKPFIDKDGRTQVPIRELCEQLNLGVYWHEDIKTVVVSGVSSDVGEINGSAGGATFRITIGERQYMLNGTYYDMDAEAKIINNRTYLPLRYLAEAMNYYVAYNPGSPSVTDLGYGYSVMNSYLGLKKETVMKEMGIDESFMLKAGDEVYSITESQEGSMYIVKNGYKKGHVIAEFYNDVLCAFFYVFKTEGEAFGETLGMYDYLTGIYGEPSTYPGLTKTVSEISPDESQYNKEVCSYSDEWQVNVSEEVIKILLGDSDNGLLKVLKLDINPRLSTVRVNLSKDVNFKNRSVFKITDKDNNKIITDENVVSCEVINYGISAYEPSAPALQIVISDEGRKRFKEATKRVSELPDGDNYFVILVDGEEIAKPYVATEIDSNEILIMNTISSEESLFLYAEKINSAVKTYEVYFSIE